jgi:menaquinone-dependent protoporphyrinogen oxidase
MENKVLVTYATKYGATAEIAEQIGATLREAGLTVAVQPAAAVTNLQTYQSVVLGSAVYIGQWCKEAIVFLETYERELTAMPVWFFSSGPTGGGDPVQLMKGWRFPEGLNRLRDTIQPRDVAFFHGFLNPKKMNWAEILLVKGIKAPMGDYRDWAMIREWANHIAEALKVMLPTQ